MTAGKDCNKCGDWHPIEQYGTTKHRGKVYIRHVCKDCYKAQRVAAAAKLNADPEWQERQRAYRREIYRKNSDNRLAKYRARYAANRDEILTRMRYRRHMKAMRKAGLIP